jgi:hypothetical protein
MRHGLAHDTSAWSTAGTMEFSEVFFGVVCVVQDRGGIVRGVWSLAVFAFGRLVRKHQRNAGREFWSGLDGCR